MSPRLKCDIEQTRAIKYSREHATLLPDEGAGGCCLCPTPPVLGVMKEVFLKSASGKLAGLGGAGVCFLLMRTSCGCFSGVCILTRYALSLGSLHFTHNVPQQSSLNSSHHQLSRPLCHFGTHGHFPTRGDHVTVQWDFHDP